MNRPLFRARNLDPSKRIRVFVDQQPDNNNNDLTNSSSSSANLLVSLSSTSTHTTTTTLTTTSTDSKFSQRCVPDMPFVSGMEREEETVHLNDFIFLDSIESKCYLFPSQIGISSSNGT